MHSSPPTTTTTHTENWVPCIASAPLGLFTIKHMLIGKVQWWIAGTECYKLLPSSQSVWTIMTNSVMSDCGTFQRLFFFFLVFVSVKSAYQRFIDLKDIIKHSILERTKQLKYTNYEVNTFSHNFKQQIENQTQEMQIFKFIVSVCVCARMHRCVCASFETTDWGHFGKLRAFLLFF